jgi:serine/threonine protein kinase
MNDYIGRQFGPYHIVRQLGMGSFGAVYLAEHRYLETLVAIKILNILIKQEMHEQFTHEARLNAHLEHPHIIRVITFDFEDRTPYLVMEYVPNGTLRTLYSKGTRAPLEQIINYVKQIASALDYAHEQHVIHRDVKPENVLLNAKREILLSDFGIAVMQRTLDSLSTQNIAGTPAYMAPEQIQSHPCPASDQYALAVMVYEWLCGEPPFTGQGVAVFGQHLYQDPPSLCARVPELAPDVEDAVFGALAKDPAQRFATVQDFAIALEEACFATQPLSINLSKGSIPQELDDSTQPLQPIKALHAPLAGRPIVQLVSPLAAQQHFVMKQSSFPVSVMCVYAPVDLVLEGEWEAHLHLLEQAGMLKVWSESHLPAGASRLQQINEHLDQANLIILLLSVDFFSSDECIALMQRALLRQHEGVTIVPLLLRPVERNASPLAALSCIPSNGVPITSWTDKDMAFELCARDIRRLLGHTLSLAPTLPPVVAPLSTTQRNRQTLLRKVRFIWIEGVLHHSLHSKVLLTLGLEKQPDAVADPWQLMLQQPETVPRPLPSGTRVTQVYDNAVGELLILGAPGAGKTTLLLELANDLLRRAEQDEQHPVPVVFNLSSWATKKQPLLVWLADELNSRYQVPPKMAQALVKADQILPLLDGLDEVALKERSACIEAINLYRQEHGLLPLVVCSRIADYLDQTVRVRLSCAVVIQPLNPQQVNDYLTRAGEGLRGLRVALQQDQALRELTYSPLLLSLLTLTYVDRSAQYILQQPSSSARIRQVIDHYVERMLTRRNERADYSVQATKHWLSWLARQLKRHNQTVFHIEHMQPDWVERPSTSKHYYRMAVGFLFALLGIIATGPVWVLLILLRLPSTSPFLSINPVLKVGLALLLTLIDGTFLGLVNALLYKQRTEKTSVKQTKPRGRWIRGSIFRSIMNGLLIGLFIGCLYDILQGEDSPVGVLVLGLIIGGAGGLVFGVIEGLLHIQPETIQPADTVTWSWMNMLRDLVKFSLIGLFCALLVGLLMAIIGFVFDAFALARIVRDLQSGLAVAQTFAPYFVITGAILGGFIGGLSGKVLGRHNTARPNQGIRRSAFLSLRTGLIGFIGIIILVDTLSLLAMRIDNGGLLSLAFIIVIIGPLITLVGALRVGGMACIQHGVLRWLLWRDRVIAWNFAHFLDHAAARILLQKVGGGYMFVHRFVLEYFAELERT